MARKPPGKKTTARKPAAKKAHGPEAGREDDCAQAGRQEGRHAKLARAETGLFTLTNTTTKGVACHPPHVRGPSLSLGLPPAIPTCVAHVYLSRPNPSAAA